MRRIIWLIVLAVLFWSGWWAAATFGVVRAINVWFEARHSEGWQAEKSAITYAGYPFDIQIAMQNVALADPETGVAVQASALTLKIPAWNIGDVTLVLPDDPILLASPERRNRLLMQHGQARLSVTPNASLALRQMDGSADAWLLEADAGDILAGGASRATFAQDTDIPIKYRFELDVDALRPGDATRAALFIPQDWPVTFELFTLTATATFDRPWDISALDVSRPQPRQITIHQAEAMWGGLQLRLAADFDVDDTGAASGTVSVQARNWRAMLILGENSGLFPAALRPQIERVLSTFAGLAGHPESLDLSVSLRDGTIFLGFLPLGPAPRLHLR